jgi:hypothetical protein
MALPQTSRWSIAENAVWLQLDTRRSILGPTFSQDAALSRRSFPKARSGTERPPDIKGTVAGLRNYLSILQDPASRLLAFLLLGSHLD